MENLDYQVLKQNIKENISRLEEQISQTLLRADRQRDGLTLIGVSKFFPANYAQAALECGLKDLGENRVQELSSKRKLLEEQDLTPSWHLIGTLQSNKVKLAIENATLIHSIDSLSLLEEMGRVAKLQNRICSGLLQVNISGEVSKHGFAPEELSRVMDVAAQLDTVRLCGIMTMAPIQSYPHEARGVFEKARVCFEALAKASTRPEDWTVLSMGMSQDFEDAILEGATHIRIGTGIFGPRPSR